MPEPTRWTPDQPLRADATDKHMADRLQWFYNSPEHCQKHLVGLVAREFAAACVAEKNEAIARLSAALDERGGREL